MMQTVYLHIYKGKDGAADIADELEKVSVNENIERVLLEVNKMFESREPEERPALFFDEQSK